MSATYQDLEIASGFDNAAGLVNLENALPKLNRSTPSGIAQARASFDPGIFRIRGDRTGSIVGREFVAWFIPLLSIEQYDYLQDNFTTGGNSLEGKVTIRTRSRQDDETYENLNCYMYLPKKADLERNKQWFTDVEIRFGVSGVAS